LNRREHYQRMAAECLRLAKDALDLTNKKLLLEMAQTWVKLAEQANETDPMPLAEGSQKYGWG
jgi:hypothetical protein